MIGVKAMLTAGIGKTGYRQFPVSKVEAYAVDGALDTDADAFSVDIGSVDNELKFLLDRDTEVRADIFTSGVLGPSDVLHLHNGIADVVSFSTDDQILSIQGRDFSSLATDSQAPPGWHKHTRPDQLVSADAKKLGFTKMQLAKVTPLTKFFRDGSESYWESWYRIYRKRKMWIWAEPDGTLVADTLHYAASPTYFIGEPTSDYPNSKQWLRVTKCEEICNKQGRVGEVWIFGERGDLGFVGKAKDPSISSWKRRPLKIRTSGDATSKNEAVREAWEEIFEGKVGALEFVVTIPLMEIGQLVRQNYMAYVNIPKAVIFP